MSGHDDALTLRQMKDHAEATRAFVEGRARADLDSDRMLAFALTRALEVIGEAARRVTEGSRARLPTIPWSSILPFATARSTATTR